MRRPLLALALALLAVPAPAVADPVLEQSSGCVRWPVADAAPRTSTLHPEDPFDIVDPTGTAPIEAWRTRWVEDGIWDGVAHLLGPRPWSTLPRVPLVVASHAEMAAVEGTPTPAGVATALCDPALGFGVALDAAPVIVGGDDLPQEVIVAHELAHVFQAGAAGRADYADAGRSWWAEASADLAAWRIEPAAYEDSGRLARAYRRYVRNPSVPLDAYAIGDVARPRSFHQYAAVVVAARLAGRVPASTLLRASFRAMGSGTPAAEAIDDLLRARRTTLVREHARFWVSRLEPGDEYERAHPTPERAAPGSRVVRLSAGRLAVDLADLVPAGAGRIELSTEGAGRDALLVALAGGAETLDWSRGGAATFCLDGTEPGARPWPGRVSLVLAADRAGAASARVRVDARRDGCREDDRPGADDGLYAGLERRVQGGLFRISGPRVRTLSVAVVLRCHDVDTGRRFERAFLARMPGSYRLRDGAFTAAARREDGLRTAQVRIAGQLIGGGRAAVHVAMDTIPTGGTPERCSYRRTFVFRRGRAA